MPVQDKFLDLLARALMSVIFLLSGLGKFAALAATQAYMKVFGIPEILVWPAATFEVGCGILLVSGLWLRPLAAVLAIWCIVTAAIFHSAFSDQMQLINFLKNLAMAGGFVLLAKHGAPGFSIEKLLFSKPTATSGR